MRSLALRTSKCWASHGFCWSRLVSLLSMQLSDLDFTQGLLALLGAPDGAVPEASASLPSDGLPSTAADAEPDARHGAEQLVVSELGAPDELPGSSGGAAAVDILRSTSGDTAIPKVCEALNSLQAAVCCESGTFSRRAAGATLTDLTVWCGDQCGELGPQLAS